jgi:adenylate cyclase
VLAARLDRLGEREKRLLQTASVIGKEFTDPLLRAVVAAAGRAALPEVELEEALAALGRAEFILEQSLYPEVEYAFKHPLTQEVAYDSLLGARRVELHAATASAIEAVEAEKLDERAALLAYHWEQAGETLKAAHWYGRAAEAAGLDSPSEALRHWERVWELSGAAPSSAEADVLRVRAGADLLILGFRQGLPPERIGEIFEEAKALAIARDDVRQQVRLLYAVGVNVILGDRPRSAIPYLEEGLALSDRSGVPELRWSAREPFEWALLQLGELAEALRMNDEQVAFSDEDPSMGTAMIGFTTSNTFMHRGAILMDLGRFEEAVAAQQRAEELARRFEDGEVAAWNDTWRSRVYQRTGDAAPALAAARRAVEAAEKIGSIFARSMAHGAYGTALGMSGDWSGSRESLDLALEIARSTGVGRFMEAYQLAALAEAHLGLGQAERAREVAEEAVQSARRMEMPVAEILARLSQVRVLLALDGAAAREEVENALSRCQELVAATGAASCEPHIHLERARLAEVLGDDTARTKLLREAHRLFRELGAVGYTERVAALLAEASA